MKEMLDVMSSIATIATPTVAALAWLWYQNDLRSKKVKLENYLKGGNGPGKTPQHTIVHLMAGLGLTEAEILQASFRSQHVKRLLTLDDKGLPNRILLEYEDDKRKNGND